MKRYAATTNYNGKPVLIERGTEGYYPLTDDFDIDAFNEKEGITEADIRAFTIGSMFGWNCDGAKLED